MRAHLKSLTVTLLLASSTFLGCRPAGWVPAAPLDEKSAEAHEARARVEYTTTPTPGGMRGGERAEELARVVRRHYPDLSLLPDGRLANLASRVTELALERGGRVPDLVEVDALARERGIVGPCPFLVLAPLVNGRWVGLEENLAAFPGNVRFTHVGVTVIEARGQVQGAVALGAQHLTLANVPREAPSNGTLIFTGKVDEEYGDPRWVWTLPDGSTRSMPLTSGKDVSWTTEPLTPGVHRFEIFGVGPTGLEVLANVPVNVGPVVASTPEAAEAVDETDPAAALVLLLNRSRAKAGEKPVARVAALDRVADGHSRDMVDAHFFGHQSPTTGTVGNRVQASGVRVLKVGENVARAVSASSAHRMLLDSPGHREIMLTAAFTHVGIGVALDTRSNPPALSITEVFASFPPPLADPAGFGAGLLDQVNRMRTEAKLPAAKRTPALDRVAQDVAARLAADPSARPADVLGLLSAADKALLGRRQVRLLPAFPSAPEEIQGAPELVDPALRHLGIGVVQAEPTADAPGANVAVFVLAD